jgi:hypothetical protein
VVTGFKHTLLPRWVSVIGRVSAGLIATGMVVRWVEVAGLRNFAGYVVWCAWLLGVAALLFRAPATSLPRTRART